MPSVRRAASELRRVARYDEGGATREGDNNEHDASCRSRRMMLLARRVGIRCFRTCSPDLGRNGGDAGCDVGGWGSMFVEAAEFLPDTYNLVSAEPVYL